MAFAGEWQRTLHPDWPEKRFHPPENIPYGWIYYAQKGTRMGFGHTAIVELTPQRHIVKTPKPNPYDLGAQERNRAEVRAEYDVYRRIGPDCPYIPKLVAWDPETCCLSIEYLENGPLSTYLGHGPSETGIEVDKIDVQPAHRRRWALQAARGLAALHALGIVHSDLGPGNVLLGGDLNLRIADFASSCAVGTRYSVCAGERYVVPGWSFGKTPEFADDIFILGCLVYFIMTGKEPHSDVESEFDVAKLYAAGQFPSVEGIACGGVIQGCWHGSLKSTDQVLQQLLEVFGVDDDPLSACPSS